MNRNIVTPGDVANIQKSNIPRALALSPPAWTDAVVPAPEGAMEGPGVAARAAVLSGAPTGTGGVPVPTADDYLTKLVKYVPVEVLGAYLLIQGTVTSNVTNGHNLAQWLGYGLIGFGVITALYDWRVLSVVRPIQIVMSVVGLAVYVFALGGWFATTSWYHAWYASIALPIYGLLVAMIPLPDLPTAPGD